MTLQTRTPNRTQSLCQFAYDSSTATQTECVLNECFLRARASRSEQENNRQTCFVLSSYHGLAVQQSLVTIWFAWKLSQGRKVGSTLAIQTAVFSWTRLACSACSCGHSSGGLLWCARHIHRNLPPACPGAWPRSSYLTSQIKLKNHLNMRLILRVGYHVLWSFSMNTAFWHYPSTPTRPAWPKDSKTVLGYDFRYVTDLVDTKNGKNRFLSLEDSNLNFGIWIFLSRAQFYVLYPSKSCCVRWW